MKSYSKRYYGNKTLRTDGQRENKIYPPTNTVCGGIVTIYYQMKMCYFFLIFAKKNKTPESVVSFNQNGGARVVTTVTLIPL